MDTLLEKDIMRMFELTAALLEENPLPIKKAADKQQISVRAIRRLIAGQLNEGALFNYQITTGKIKRVHGFGLFTGNQPEIIAALFDQSHNLSLLILCMKQPVLSFSLLSDTAYISATTLHRRFACFDQFLSPYSISIDRRTYPFVSGNERQIRFLLFKLTAFLLPALCDAPALLYQHFLDIHTLRQQVLYATATSITSGKISPDCYVPDYYLTNEAAYLFLWKQLLAQETFFVPAHEAILITKIAASFIQDSDAQLWANNLSQIYQIHLVCALLEGNIFVFQPVVLTFSDTTVQLIRSFLLQLPHYEKLLKKHPELPMLYECVWQKQSIFQPMFTIKNTPPDT
ncbi:helix-turn-helix domain-containing protein [Candidatus Enterococcus testudinis]|nr:helix-turn-helix domain-containing protein [Enterococcus sp. 8G7_MSG3316]